MPLLVAPSTFLGARHTFRASGCLSAPDVHSFLAIKLMLFVAIDENASRDVEQIFEHHINTDK